MVCSMPCRIFQSFFLTATFWMLLLAMAGSEAQAQPTIAIESPAFAAQAIIPRDYTCSGADKSPPLVWSGIPQSARTVALVVDDPDAPAGVWVHWVLYNLPASV